MRIHRSAVSVRTVRAAGITVAAMSAIGLFSTGAANADTFVPLQDGHITRPGVQIDSVGQHALISPSLAANGAGRVVWVSGNVSADVDTPEGKVGPWNGPSGAPGTNNSSTHGASTMTVGYVVGCQVDLGSLSTNMSTTLSTSPSLTGSLSLPLAPGQVKWVYLDQVDMPESGKYHYDYQDQQLEIQGCAGYAQARQAVVVEVVGADYSKTTLYGQPFSLG